MEGDVDCKETELAILSVEIATTGWFGYPQLVLIEVTLEGLEGGLIEG